jgi:hypothetical protein
MGIFHPLDLEYPPYVIPQIGQTSKQFRMMLCIEPHEVLIIALNEHCRPRYSSVFSQATPKNRPRRHNGASPYRSGWDRARPRNLRRGALAQAVRFDFSARDLPLAHRIQIARSVQMLALLPITR